MFILNKIAGTVRGRGGSPGIAQGVSKGVIRGLAQGVLSFGLSLAKNFGAWPT